jgi:two-component system cell cycle response regulator
MLLDLDRFKSINDTHGHAVGDQVLTEVAKRMQDNLRGMDLVARIGGEEFLVSMPMTNLVTARHAAERLREVICATPVATAANGAPITVSASIGLAMGGAADSESMQDTTEGSHDAISAGASIDTLLFIADRALYDAKAEGRNQVTLGSHAA